MSADVVIPLAVVALGIVAAAVLAVRKLRNLGTLRIAGPLGTSVEMTAAEDTSDGEAEVTVLALARRLGELDERVRVLELERVADRATIARLEAELADTRRRLTGALSERSKLANRVKELEQHVVRLEAALAVARGDA